MRASPRFRRVVLAALATVGFVACGARSELDVGPGLPPEPECARDDECPGFDDLCHPVKCTPSASGDIPAHVCIALTPVDCDDNDPCTKDECDPKTGECHYSHATPDLDGDGYFAPLPGKRPGEPGSCGDDCNDADP